MNKFFQFLFGLVFLVAGIFILWSTAVKPITMSFSMLNWHSVPAKLDRFYIDSSSSRKRKTHRFREKKQIQIEYIYEFESILYKGNQLEVNPKGGSGKIDKINISRRFYKISKNIKNSDLLVWVNPNFPAESIYTRKPNFRPLLAGIVISSFFLYVSGLILYSTFKPLPTKFKFNCQNEINHDRALYLILNHSRVLSFLFFGAFTVSLIGNSVGQTITAIILLLPFVILSQLLKKKCKIWKKTYSNSIN